jgi:hypothetical protein
MFSDGYGLAPVALRFFSLVFSVADVHTTDASYAIRWDEQRVPLFHGSALTI